MRSRTTSPMRCTRGALAEPGILVLLTELTRFIDSRRDVYQHIRGSGVFDQAVEQWHGLLAPGTDRFAARVAADRPGTLQPGDVAALSSFILDGLTELIRTWLRSPDPASPETEAALMWQHLRRFLVLDPDADPPLEHA